MAEVVERLSHGETLLGMCPVQGVHRTSILAWVASNPEAADKYARARELQAEAHADSITSAAEGALRGEHDPYAARVFIDAMKWQASKLRPKIYGDRIDVTATATLERIERVELAPELRGVLQSLGRKYARQLPAGDEAPVIEASVVAEPEREVPTPKNRKRARIPKRERVKHMSARRRAKYEANRAALEVARAALRKPKRAGTKRKGAKR